MPPAGTRFAMALVMLSASAARGAAPVPPTLFEQAEREGRVRVIARLDAAPALGAETAPERAPRRVAIAQAAERALAMIGGPARPDLRRYTSLPLLALEASPRELEALAASGAVLGIEADRRNWPHLAQSGPLVSATGSAAAGFDGTGRAIAILDTGVESAHPFFEGRVVAQACFSAGRNCPNGQQTQYGPPAGEPCTYGALCWHGTHLAGIAAGHGTSFQGVAPGADLIAIQTGSELTGAACGSAGSPCVTLYDSDAIAALEYVADTLSARYAIAAVNMSFGGDTAYNSESTCDAQNGAMKLAVAGVVSHGIAAVAAAGNQAINNGIDAPACLSNVVGVGATTDTSDQVWVQSNSGNPLDLWAPGVSITASVPGGYATHSGTSMATPHVAGAFAVLQQADPAASLSTLRSALASTGVPVTDPDNGLTRPRIQVDDAVRARAPARCFDGLDNDGDGRIDVDGDGSVGDPQCVNGFDDSEGPTPPGCGIGPELVLALGLLAARCPRSRNRGSARGFRSV